MTKHALKHVLLTSSVLCLGLLSSVSCKKSSTPGSQSGQAKAAVFVGMFSADNARERYRGIQDGLKGDAGAAPATNPAAAAPANRQVKTVPAGKAVRLAFVTNNPSEFWKLASNGVKKYVEEAKGRGEQVTVDVKMPQNGTVAEQNQILEDLVAQGYDGIAISVIAPQAQVPEIDRAAAKTNVICHDSDAPASKRLVYIGTNNYEAGRRLGQQIRTMKLVPDGPVDLLQPKEDNKDTKAAQTNVEDVLTGQGDVKLLIGLWSYNGPAIADALGSSPRKNEVKAAVFDEEDATLDAIQKGVIQCTVVQKPYQFGYQSSKLLHELAMKGASALPAGDKVDTGVEVITSGPTSATTKNVEQFRKELAEQKK